VKVLSNVAQSGLDSHKRFAQLTARDHQKNVVVRMKLDYTDREAMARQLSQLPPGSPVIMESSFGWGWVCDELAQVGLSPYLASAGKVSDWRKLRSSAKSNRIDADALSELPLAEEWWRVWLAPREVRDQRELLRYRMGLVKCQMQTKLRIHALLHRHGIILPGADLFGVSGRQRLNALVESDTLRETARLTLAGHLQLLDQLRKLIAAATRLFRQRMVGNPVAGRLRTVPGVALVLGYTILAEVGDFARFASGKKLCAYACLVPLANDSGEMDESAPQGRHVGHAGRRTLKWAFIEAAHGAVRKDAYFRQIFNRRTDDGQRDRNRGYIAVARQLCQIVYVCQKQGRGYRPAVQEAGTIRESVNMEK
jgi:transposase